ncbi:MAG TPA: tetratricopeptide repeat protein, partial [Kofleriaceae bacterium]
MIEATCAACGTVNRIAEADVPVGAKFVSCTSCKSKVALPAKATTAGPPKMAIPAIPSKLPTPPAPSPRPIDIADLPAPKRQSPLAGTEPASKPAPRSALTDAELPVPKGAGKPPGPQPSALDLDDLMASEPPSAGLADLPAPKPRSSPLADLPGKPAPKPALADLSAPKKPAEITDLPAPKSPLSDLPSPRKPGEPARTATPARGVPAPARPSGHTDLPVPKTATPARGVPAPARPSGNTDLPVPKTATPARGISAARPGGNTDLPMPKAATPARGAPAVRPGNALPPKAATPASGAPAVRPGNALPPKTATPPRGSVAVKPPAGVTDLPMPKPGVTGLLTPKPQGLELDDDLDLPMPAAGVTGLPTPKPGTQDIAPKGFFDDLPQPAKQQGGGIDLPAPKGFFDDLPQPAHPSKQGGATQDIAPKGFFDDLPQPAAAAKQGGAAQDIAPKGFFDDLPQPAAPAKQGGATQDLAPKGLFDDLPNPAKPAAAATAAASTAGLFDDIQQPTAKSAANAALGAGEIDLGPVDGAGLDLEAGGNSGPDLDLGLPLGQDQAFQDLDLSEPTAGRPKPVADDSPIKIKTPASGAGSRPLPIVVPAKPGAGGELKLDLADDPHDPARTARAAAQRISPKRKAELEADSPEARAAKRRRSRIVLGSLLVVVALGAGGFMFYQRHVAAKAKADEITRQLNSANRWLKAEDPRHWDKAAAAAEEVVKLDATNPRALGLGAEALIAGALDNGINKDVRIQKGRVKIEDALGAGRTSPEVERAQAVAAIAAKGQATRAVGLLKAQIAKTPKDGWLQLYLGWAQNAKGDAAEAIKAFDQAIALAPVTKVPALYGQGQAKLVVADIAGAQAAFEEILKINKDHVCANVGLIATRPPSKSVELVAELEAVLQRKDIAVSDPRCVVRAHTLIGDVHRKAGRDDMARQRYNDALKLVKNDVPAHNGLAAVELRAGKLQLAAEHIAKALTEDPENPVSQLLQAELHIREGKLPDAQATIDKLAARQPPLPTLVQAHLFVVKGKLLEAKGQAEEAIAAFVEGAKLAGELDLTPTMEAVKELAELAKKATDQTKAAEYRNRATQLLQPLEERAKDDAQLCVELGIAYMEAGDLVKAEEFLRRAVALKGDDPEAKLQLAKALNVQKKYDDAITQLKEAQQL